MRLVIYKVENKVASSEVKKKRNAFASSEQISEMLSAQGQVQGLMLVRTDSEIVLIASSRLTQTPAIALKRLATDRFIEINSGEFEWCTAHIGRAFGRTGR